jgi:hypothetical protein
MGSLNTLSLNLLSYYALVSLIRITFMMQTLSFLGDVGASAITVREQDLLSDNPKNHRYWGQISPCADSPDGYFCA